jgi:hypothetical protein
MARPLGSFGIVGVAIVLIAVGAWPLTLVVCSVLSIWIGSRWKVSVAAQSNEPDFPNDSGRDHTTALVQSWQRFLSETYRQQKNSGAHVRLGNGFEIGIVGESFHLPELQRVRAQPSDSDTKRTRFTAYLIPEPENPHSANRTCVRVESPRGLTIGHLSNEHAESYAPVFKALHDARRVGVCRAVAVGGTRQKPNIGVWITIGHPSWLSELINEARALRKPRYQRPRTLPPAAEQPF